jgi:hypothetical protein
MADVRITPSPPEEFADAMATLNTHFGTVVEFQLPGASGVYPSGTTLDPETGRPYDPTIKPTGASGATASARVGVYFGTTNEDADDSALGILGDAEGMVDVRAEDYDTENLAFATHVIVRNVRYKIVNWRPDGMGDAIQRYLGYLEQG